MQTVGLYVRSSMMLHITMHGRKEHVRMHDSLLHKVGKISVVNTTFRATGLTHLTQISSWPNYLAYHEVQRIRVR